MTLAISTGNGKPGQLEKVDKGRNAVRSALIRLLVPSEREVFVPQPFTTKHKHSDTYAGPKHCPTFKLLNEEENPVQHSFAFSYGKSG